MMCMALSVKGLIKSLLIKYQNEGICYLDFSIFFTSVLRNPVFIRVQKVVKA